jgi:hypothetical protein
MPSEESPWHADLEAALSAEAERLGLPGEVELRWSMIPPMDDWIVNVAGVAGEGDVAVVVTARQLALTAELVRLLDDSAGTGLIRILALPDEKFVPQTLSELLEATGIEVLRFSDN